MASNTHFAVAAHALTVLGYLQRLTTSEQIATSINTNPVVVRRVLSSLVKAGIVRSIPGKKGGFELARPAKQIKLAEVYSAIDEGGVFRIHDQEENAACPVSCGMKSALEDVLERVDTSVLRELGKSTVADLVRHCQLQDA